MEKRYNKKGESSLVGMMLTLMIISTIIIVSVTLLVEMSESLSSSNVTSQAETSVELLSEFMVDPFIIWGIFLGLPLIFVLIKFMQIGRYDEDEEEDGTEVEIKLSDFQKEPEEEYELKKEPEEKVSPKVEDNPKSEDTKTYQYKTVRDYKYFQDKNK